MNIKSLLIGSAAALAVVSGAQAADAIVAAEPEPMEYVRVCDAFGTGYFYIPGTETCLKIGGEVRATLGFNDAEDLGLDEDQSFNSTVRARISFEAKNDSEIGTIGSYIRLEANQGALSDINTAFGVEQAYITVGGFKVGRVLTWADDWGLAGESDDFFGEARFNTVSYTYTSDAFTVGLGVDDLSDDYAFITDDNEVGVQGVVTAAFGPASLAVNGVYDFAVEEGAIGGVLTADLGPGTLGIAGAYATGQSAAYDFASEWTVGAAYTFNATEKLAVTAQAVYWGDYGFSSSDAWGADLLVEYKLAQGLKASADVQYTDIDDGDDNFEGFVRLTRSF
ncbi:porin [Peteryoungia ipomoeae]|uniref:Porin n=1 Tax=Peteryoungia ipomoeae TaxID=1210932 RepID=A0A4S8P7X7_9HYPH|nr:porin [Peteryoungia ipomoeae]THV25751.1 porin [Peteryoungia ipomoeae]